MDIQDLCDYIILQVTSAGETLNHLKLQKLMYYCQAWNLAFDGSPLVDAEFQAWVHGPVNRAVFDRLSKLGSMYVEITPKVIRDNFSPECLTEDERFHVDSILGEYATYSGAQLEVMTHREDPWIKARGGCRPTERCETVIENENMKTFYAARLN